MQTVLFLFPQLNLSAPKEEPYRIIKQENQEGKGENKNRLKEKRNRLSLLLQKAESREIFIPFPSKPEKSNTPPDEPPKWSESLDQLLAHKSGLGLFRAFLQSEYSEENIEFWMACEDYKKTKSPAKLASKAKKIYSDFIETDAPKEVNIDFRTKEVTKKNTQLPTLSCFDLAQSKVHTLMEKDSYPRFLKSEFYRDLLKQAPVENNGQRRRSQSFTSAGLLQNSEFTAWL
ncbi:regulator of G-protein signaling 21-like [Hemiscyllium ocellatum]|uniref:regulator of G-protein signaling 21-like n=1 Tax=Hemiscyllium ocellatum TaxID=170820 RepID=UPI0029670333|nr:regulator of G-protein signaling 21-like [Hemiscyllium ocellatum]